MAEIRPRWEWRIFESAPSAAIASAIARLDEPVAHGGASEEIYILSRDSPHNVKIRAGQLDVKLLEAERAPGLERWRPALKQGFPIAANAFAPVWGAWGVAPLATIAPLITFDALLHDIVEAVPALRAVPLAKYRARITVAGCAGEHVRIDVANRAFETLAFEDEDPERIIAAVRALGLEHAPTDSYPAALKRITDIARSTTPPQRVLV